MYSPELITIFFTYIRNAIKVIYLTYTLNWSTNSKGDQNSLGLNFFWYSIWYISLQLNLTCSVIRSKEFTSIFSSTKSCVIFEYCLSHYTYFTISTSKCSAHIIIHCMENYIDKYSTIYIKFYKASTTTIPHKYRDMHRKVLIFTKLDWFFLYLIRVIFIFGIYVLYTKCKNKVYSQ